MGDTVRYVCNPGYELIGTVTAKCTGSGKFNGKVPTCASITCLNPGSPTYASINPDLPQYVFGTTITYVCIDGYETNDETESVCSRNGLFSNPPPVCTMIIVSCRFPGNPVNGVTTPKKVSYEVAERITYQCNRGYTISGVTSSICTSQGNFTGRVPTCKVTTCKNPGELANGYFRPNILNYGEGQSIRYFCHEGYRINGHETAECEDGTFDRAQPRCEPITCAYPGSPTDGKTFPRRSSYTFNQTVEYRCDDDYELIGSNKARCIASGKFDNEPSLCRKITCLTPEKPKFGGFKPFKLRYGIGDFITYECSAGYQLRGDEESKCLSTGAFSSQAPLCIRRQCKYLVELNNGNIFPKQQLYDIGDTIKYRCDDGYRKFGADSATCQNDGTFSADTPNCRSMRI
uniref:Putative soluble C3b receptor CR1_S1 n=1 Tax=Botryllus schlosseri TaxID=30301 RepID=A0A7S6BFR2_BOTSH|nr:putative soluble C3b receptor CR1_S1 [Botryllus schlosseri]